MRQEVLNLCRIYFFYTKKQNAVERKNSYRIFYLQRKGE